jgi:tetratricopeptide (TPR) repeat protein
MAWLQGDSSLARIRLETSVGMLRSGEDVRALGWALSALANVMESLDGLEEARRLAEEAIYCISRTGQSVELAYSLVVLGKVLRREGDRRQAVGLYQRAASMLREVSDSWMLVWVLGELACLASSESEYDQATRYWRESLVLSTSLAEHWSVSVGLAGIADACFRHGRHADAARLLGAAEAIRELATNSPRDFRLTEVGRCVGMLAGALGEGTLESLWRDGRRLSRDEALALAFAVTDPSGTPDASVA